MKNYRLYLVRHGVTQGNLDGIYMGSGTDQPLCAQGAAQLRALAARFPYPKAETVFSSPMRRAVETVELLFPDAKDKIILADLRENAFGEFEGRKVTELVQDEPGGGYLRELERQLARIENADIRAKAARLREHTEDIFAWVKLHPECADDARRFCSYYLPTAVKLLNTYNEVAPHADESSVAAGIQSEVSQVLDTMSTAFRGLMDNLLQNTAVDMQAEISALETVLAQEGLAQNGFTMQK